VKKYKIAFVVNHFPSVSETFILNQITDIIDRGHVVKIFSFNTKKTGVIHKTVADYELIQKTTYGISRPDSIVGKLLWYIYFIVRNFSTLPLIRVNGLRQAVNNLSLSLALEDFLNNSEFDIVHAHFGQRGAVVADLIAKGLKRKFKFVTSFHGYDLIPSLTEQYKVGYKNIFSFSDAITVNSKYLEGILLNVFPAPKKLLLLPEGLKTGQYEKKRSLLRDRHSDFRLVFCGRLVKFKAPGLAVQIVNILVNNRNQKHVRLQLIGNGPLREEVGHLIEKFGLKNHVLMLGALSQEEVILQMNNADIFILPGIQETETGRAEAQGLVIQEAQAMELPVLVSTAGGMKYGLIDGITGFVVNEDHLEEFADKIELLMSDTELARAMGQKGREFIVNNFDTTVLGDKLVKLYADITNEVHTLG